MVNISSSSSSDNSVMVIGQVAAADGGADAAVGAGHYAGVTREALRGALLESRNRVDELEHEVAQLKQRNSDALEKQADKFHALLQRAESYRCALRSLREMVLCVVCGANTPFVMCCKNSHCVCTPCRIQLNPPICPTCRVSYDSGDTDYRVQIMIAQTCHFLRGLDDDHDQGAGPSNS